MSNPCLSKTKEPAHRLLPCLLPLLLFGLAFGFGSVTSLHGVQTTTAFAQGDATHYVVDVHIDPANRLVTGTVEINFPKGDYKDLRFWLYADRNRVAPKVLNDLNARWVFPNNSSFGSIRIKHVAIDGHIAAYKKIAHRKGSIRGLDYAGSDLIVQVPKSNLRSRPKKARIEFSIKVPNRFGRIGKAKNILSLTAPWYPILLKQKDTLFQEATHTVTWQLTNDDQVLTPKGIQGSTGTEIIRGTYLPMAISENWNTDKSTLSTIDLNIYSNNAIYRHPNG